MPANAAVVVTGDVDVQEVKRLAEKYYGPIAARPVPARKPRDEPVQTGAKRLDFKGVASQAYVSLSFKVPKLLPADFADDKAGRDALALTVLAAVLDGYSGARLNRALEQDSPTGVGRVADSADAYNGLLGRGPQLFVLAGVPAPGKTPDQLATSLRQQVALIAQSGVNDAELARVKVQWVAGETYKLDSVFKQAREFGSNWLNGFPLDADARLIAKLRSITGAEVQAVAAKYFGDDQMTVATLVPQPLDPNAPRKLRAAPTTPARH